MPRIERAAAPGAATTLSNTRFGDAPSSPRPLVWKVCSICCALIVFTASGTFCEDSSRLRAVTTIS